jgi:hypothetical protein
MGFTANPPCGQPRSSSSDSRIFSSIRFHKSHSSFAFQKPGGAPAVKHCPMTCFSFSLPHDARGDVNSATHSSKYTVRVRKWPSLEGVRRRRRQDSAKQGACRTASCICGPHTKSSSRKRAEKRGPIALFEQAQNDKPLHISVRGETRLVLHSPSWTIPDSGERYHGVVVSEAARRSHRRFVSHRHRVDLALSDDTTGKRESSSLEPRQLNSFEMQVRQGFARIQLSRSPQLSDISILHNHLLFHSSF